MSLPHRPLLPNNSVMEDKTPRLGAPFSFLCPPTSSPSSQTAVFPPLQIFPNSMQQYQLFLMQMLQQNQNQQQVPPQRLSAGASPVNSDEASSRSESPLAKRLVLDEDGCATCSVCTEKIPEAQWNQHIDLEKERLINYITLTKEKRERENTPDHFDQKRKRELELQRIRSNQHKRQSLKRGPLSRDCLTPFSRQSNDETGSSESPDMKKDDEFFMKCSTCQMPCPYAIIMTALDRPKCQMCFDLVRAAVLTSSGSPESSTLIKEEEHDGSPMCKKVKLEDLIVSSA